MSSGTFVRSKYAATYNGGDQIHPIRVQPETLAAVCDGVTNSPPTGNPTSPISAVTSRGSRALGLKPRKVTIAFPSTDGPEGYKPGGITVIPALTPAFYAKASVRGAKITYLGKQCEVVSGTPEEAV